VKTIVLLLERQRKNPGVEVVVIGERIERRKMVERRRKRRERRVQMNQPRRQSILQKKLGMAVTGKRRNPLRNASTMGWQTR